MKIQPGHEVLSLFGMSSNNQALTQKSSNKLAVSLVSAFLIVLSVSILLGVATRILGGENTVSAVSIIDSEPVAFEPGQNITRTISQGYLGNYR